MTFDNGYDDRMFCLEVKEIPGKPVDKEAHLCMKGHPHEGDHECMGCGDRW